MSYELLLKKLVNAAKRNKPSDNVPYAFEKRIMARIYELKANDTATLWAQLLWRAVKPCLLVMIIACLIALFTQMQNGFEENPSKEFETAVLAGLNTIGDNW